MDLRGRLSEIHRHLLGGSRTASADAFLTAHAPIVGFLVKKYPHMAVEDRHDIATDVIVQYLAEPEKCDESKGSLWSYLCNAAQRDAQDLVRKRQHRSALLAKATNDVELWLSRANYLRNDDETIDAKAILDRYGARLVTNEVEAGVLRLILSEERETAAFAAVMHISPEAADSVDIVKKAKDKMLLRLRRLRDELEG